MKTKALLFFLGMWLAYLPFHPGHPLTVDSVVTLDTVRAMAQGSLVVPKAMVTRPGRDGAQYSLYGPLLPLISQPAYKLVSWVEGSSTEPGSTSMTWADKAALGTNQWISALIVAILFLLALLWGAPLPWAMGVAIASAFSTMLLPYSRDYFTQPLAALCLFSGFLCLQHSVLTASEKVLALSSLMMGMAVLTRMDMLVLAPGFLLSGLLALRRSEAGISCRSLSLLVGPLLMCFVLLLVFDWYRWGEWFSTPYSRMPFSTPLIDSLPRFFSSHDLSILLYNPLLIPAFFFLILTWRELGWLWSGILVSSVSYLILISSYVDYHGGVCPGPRYLLVLVPLNLLPLVMGLGQPSSRTFTLGAVLVVCCGVGLMMNGYAACVDYSQAPTAWDFWRGLLWG